MLELYIYHACFSYHFFFDTLRLLFTKKKIASHREETQAASN